MKIRQFILISVIVVVITFISIAVRHFIIRYDLRKDNIFQIPGTTCEYYGGGNTYIHEEYFFIQRYPKNKSELKITLMEFVEKNIQNCVTTSSTKIYVYFMVPDSNLPIWFEENKSYFTMDDHISNYIKGNCLALCVINNKDNGIHLHIYSDDFKLNSQ